MNPLAWLVVTVIAAGLCVLFVEMWRANRRLKRIPGATLTGPPAGFSDSELDDRLYAEQRDLISRTADLIEDLSADEFTYRATRYFDTH